jgi:hypothetical protein
MGEAQTIKAFYNDKIRPANLRQLVLPGIGTGIGATITAGNNPALGVWIDVALLAAVTADTMVVGLVMDTPSAAVVWTVGIGSCEGYVNAAALNGVAAAVIAAHRAWVRIHIQTDAGINAPVMLDFPVFIPNGVGILARGYTVAGGQTANISVLCVQGFE